MSSGIYNIFKQKCMTGEMDLSGDTILVGLMTNSHAFSASHNYWSDVSSNEINPSGFVGYIAGGGTLDGLSVYGTTTAKWNAADITWNDSTIIAYHAVVYNASASGALICSIDFGAMKSTEAEDFKIRWDNIDNAIIMLT
jgi:hypothetical protein